MKRSPPPPPSPSPSPSPPSPSSPPSSSSSNSSSTSNPSKRAKTHKSTKPKARKSSKKATIQSKEAISPNGSAKRSSIYRGVTRHRWTGRFEAHLWDKDCYNSLQNKKGKQVYLGAYDSEEAAAHAYDFAALKYWGPETTLNFPLEMYERELEEMQGVSKEEYLASLRRRSSGFSRGVSKYRGVARHHHNGRWEARIGRVFGNKYLYLGTFSTQEEAAQAYDLAAIEYRGANAVTNFDINCYLNQPRLLAQLQQEQPVVPALQEEPQYLQSENTVQELKSSELKVPGDIDEPHAVDENIDESLWSLCMDYELDGYTVTGANVSDSTNLSEWFNEAAFEGDIECLFEGCSTVEEGSKYGAGVEEISLVEEGNKLKEDVSDREGTASQVKNVSFPPKMISVCN